MTFEHPKVVIENVTIFDGQQIQNDRTIAFENGIIVADSTGADIVINGNGAFISPGFIDSHVHVHDAEDLLLLARHGVTTGLDMGTANMAFFQKARGGFGTCDVRSPGIPAMPPNSRLSSRPGFPQKWLVTGPDDADRFVSDRISDGADYIKVMLEDEGPDSRTVKSLVTEAHNHGKKIIAHATTCETIEKAVEARVDVITHVPLELSLKSETVAQMKADGLVAVPTLVKMLATAEKNASLDFTYSTSSAKKMRAEGILLLAGSDANKNASGHGKVSYGEGLLKELQLLVEVGLSPVEALQSATSLPASFFGLKDRGVIAPGKRADIVLLTADATKDIHNLTSIQRVWCGGMEVAKEGGSS